MPGSSLWLLPPPSHPLHAILTTLIHTTLPTGFPREASASSPRVAPHFFPAHVTLSSGIDPAVYGGDDAKRAQAWLDRLPFPSSSSSSSSFSSAEAAAGGATGAKVRFERVVSQDVFYRRCFVRVGFDGVRVLAGVARAVGVLGEEVGRGEDGGVRFGEGTERWLAEWKEEFGPHVSLMYGDEPIADETLKEITKVVQQAGLKLSGEPGNEQDSAWDGWDGGVVWLVPTDKPISEWGTPIATRQL